MFSFLVSSRPIGPIKTLLNYDGVILCEILKITKLTFALLYSRLLDCVITAESH